MSEIDDVRAFREKFEMTTPTKPTQAPREELAERANHILEELFEFAGPAGLDWDGSMFVPSKIYDTDDAHQDFADQADALVDLVYVALGTALRLGLPWRELWDDVQRANMEKVPMKTARAKIDAIKPPGWRGPRTRDIIAASMKDRA